MVYTEFIQKLHVLEFFDHVTDRDSSFIKAAENFSFTIFLIGALIWMASIKIRQSGRCHVIRNHVIFIIESSRDDHERSWIYNEQKPKLDYEKQNGFDISNRCQKTIRSQNYNFTRATVCIPDWWNSKKEQL